MYYYILYSIGVDLIIGVPIYVSNLKLNPFKININLSGISLSFVYKAQDICQSLAPKWIVIYIRKFGPTCSFLYMLIEASMMNN